MANIIASPTRYIQGKGELQNLRQHVEMLGKKLFILTTASGQARVAPAINASVAGSDCTAVYEPFHGECSQSEIDRVVADFQASLRILRSFTGYISRFSLTYAPLR